MSALQIELLAIAVIAAVACSLPGVFLVLRGVALMSDAISHSILLGIIIMFLFVGSLSSPLLLVGAACAGMATVWCTEKLMHTGLLKKETAIGLVFPLFFSIGVILITVYARNVHLDSDMVLLGDIAFAPFQRLVIWGADIGPYALWQLIVMMFVNIAIIKLFYKELLLVTFNQEYAAVIGFSPTIVHYLIMGLSSLTAVAAFDIVGAVVVVALMITPAASAFLITERLSDMIKMSIFFSVGAALFGYFFALYCDVSIAGSIAMMAGIFFFSIFAGTAFRSSNYYYK